MAKTTKTTKTTKTKATKTTTKGQTKIQPQAQQGLPVLPITVNAQYIKDLSFETPGPFITSKNLKEAPNISLNIEVRANTLEDKRYEVELHVTAKATNNNEKVFILDMTYAGAFTLNDIPEQNIPPVLLIECPRLLFPFARNIVADVTRDGGFPPLALSPIDFAEIYRRQLAKVQAEQAKKK